MTPAAGPMILADVTAGLCSIASNQAQREAAVRNLTTWWNGAQYAVFRPQLESLARRQQWALLFDAFYRVMPFGTGGRRGPVGIGPNRLNHETVITSVQGHVHYLRCRYPGVPLRVVVAYDVRVFRDLRGLYDASVPNPLLGVSSHDFARLAVAVYAANGAEVYTVQADDFFMATPELSFAIRHLGAHGGLNMSASHNHPDDNGAKIYLASGGQPIPPEDEALARAVEAVTEVPPAKFDDAVRAGRVKWWDAALHERYIEANLACAIDRSARQARIAYTPLHGTGRCTVGAVLRRAGFDVRYVERQMQPDGAFPEVKFHIPNPEVPESMELVTAEARQCGADAGFATDPDADRLGVVAPVDGEWRYLTGNEIAVLLAAYIVEARREQGTRGPAAFMIKTAVTTELLTRIACANGVQMVGDLLVGFKYVGHVLDAIERDGSFGDVRGTLDDFLLAAEESHGVLVNPQLRDKDAAGGALLLAELCARLRQRGSTLGGYLNDVYRRYGYVANVGYSLVMEGVTGLDLVTRIMDELRRQPPQLVDGRKLRQATDYWDEKTFGGIRSDTDRSARNFVRLAYEGELSVSVRPSGTEPKIKIYVERVFDPSPSWAGDGFAAARRAMDAATGEVTLGLVDQLLCLIGIELPRPALLLSSLVSLDHRIDFAQRFLPELEAQLCAAGPGDAARLTGWVDERLKAYGADPRYLVAAAVAEFFSRRPLAPGPERLLRQIFSLPV
jgi:phosphoglucomutase